MKYLMMLISLAAVIPCRAQFLLDGKVSGYKGKYIYLQYADDKGAYIRDSTEVKNGLFRFSGYVSEPFMAALKNNSDPRSYSDSGTVSLFLEPKKMTISVEEGNFSNAQVEGSASQKQYGAMQQQMRYVNKKWKVVMDTLSAVNKRSNFEYQELKNWVLLPFHMDMEEIYDRSMNQYPASYVTAYYLRFKVNELSEDSLKKWYAGFPEKVKQSKYGKSLNEEIQKKKIGIPGTMARGFSSEDIEGKQLSLADYQGKYVLLDFWASWCLPCRKGNPHLKELYGKYKDKGFEIIGISDDDSKPDAWRKAVEKDGTGVWKHVLRGMKRTDSGFDRTNDKSDFYNIHSLPTKILIDPNGQIIGRYTGEGEEDKSMDEKLATIFEK
ncbi:Thiol-disulfide isomerase or thioredoxin [Chitinophaga sp. YR627]|uniref:TlpA disulfide reductase family protein n=1 Tax=Chitinophaga sp. YR627 TaxID=1881041 RepID=UPI0008E34137|nr:TlpA disulfide reductase family protein [Chitinophaga sp. YR627]SFN33438.1 Thiol-disulfide isomerase or thioredoxin [Chitinophaga sp. YR627]